jgi:hypothetical protein
MVNGLDKVTKLLSMRRRSSGGVKREKKGKGNETMACA